MNGDKCIITVLGTAQDAGIPQIGCECRNCISARSDDRFYRLVASLAIINPATGKCYLIDCTPDFKKQFGLVQALRDKYLPRGSGPEVEQDYQSDLGLDGILLTHAHMGHYIGLLQLGKEAYASNSIPTYATRSMKKFLSSNQPFKGLIKNRNIEPLIISHGKPCVKEDNLLITPYLVQHRHEYSDTIGFQITGPEKRLLYIPDMDKFTKPILEIIPKMDYIIMDGTFFDRDELGPRRKYLEVPHLTISESIPVLKQYLKTTRVFYSHFNHSNPALDPESSEAKNIKANGFGIVPERWTFKI
jgi:pyrroloquinoline quinone biosynthesis protein B